jgi:S1-C subfamily serine protease
MNNNVGSEVSELQSTAGKVLYTTHRKGKTPASSFSAICHEAPVRFGDSGGPLITRDGKLIAVTTDGGIAALRPISAPGWAVQPNLSWLQSAIDADAAAHVGQTQ